MLIFFVLLLLYGCEGYREFSASAHEFVDNVLGEIVKINDQLIFLENFQSGNVFSKDSFISISPEKNNSWFLDQQYDTSPLKGQKRNIDHPYVVSNGRDLVFTRRSSSPKGIFIFRVVDHQWYEFQQIPDVTKFISNASSVRALNPSSVAINKQFLVLGLYGQDDSGEILSRLLFFESKNDGEYLFSQEIFQPVKTNAMEQDSNFGASIVLSDSNVLAIGGKLGVYIYEYSNENQEWLPKNTINFNNYRNETRYHRCAINSQGNLLGFFSVKEKQVNQDWFSLVERDDRNNWGPILNISIPRVNINAKYIHPTIISIQDFRVGVGLKDSCFLFEKNNGKFSATYFLTHSPGNGYVGVNTTKSFAPTLILTKKNGIFFGSQVVERFEPDFDFDETAFRYLISPSVGLIGYIILCFIFGRFCLRVPTYRVIILMSPGIYLSQMGLLWFYGIGKMLLPSANQAVEFHLLSHIYQNPEPHRFEDDTYIFCLLLVLFVGLLFSVIGSREWETKAQMVEEFNDVGSDEVWEEYLKWKKENSVCLYCVCYFCALSYTPYEVPAALSREIYFPDELIETFTRKSFSFHMSMFVLLFYIIVRIYLIENYKTAKRFYMDTHPWPFPAIFPMISCVVMFLWTIVSYMVRKRSKYHRNRFDSASTGISLQDAQVEDEERAQQIIIN